MNSLQRVSARRGPRQRGNSMIEFALASSVLFLLTFGVVDFARLFYLGDVVASAAAAATQYGALSPAHYGDFTGMEVAARLDAQNPPNMTVSASEFCACSIGGPKTTCPAACPGATQRYIQVTVSIPFTTVVNYPGIPPSTPISSTSVVRVQ